jgi:signal transduction histidine kinase
MQQAVNEQSLQISGLKKQTLARLLPALDLLVLVRREDDTFGVLGDAPSWAREVLACGETLELDEVFPFLESFLPEAEEVWLDAAPPARSGVWIQEIGQAELAFEATAVRAADDLHVLIVEPRLSEMAEQQALVQKARDGALRHRQLLKEVEKKEILLHCIVHDLKQPLSVIKGSLGLIGAAGLPQAESEKLIGVAANQVEKQERMIRNVLDVFATDLAELDPAAQHTSATTDLLGCARGAVDDFKPAFEDKGLHLDLKVESRMRECQVRGERGRLERVFANLLENALKHTPPDGEATVSVDREGQVAKVSVQNDGAEIPEELRDRLFQRFARDTHKGGAGLGLYYCAMTLERWGGGIRYEPHTGGGTRFIFELPIVEEEPEQSCP